MLLNISVNKATNFKWDTVDFKHKQEILPYLSLLHQQTHIPILYVTHSQQEVTHYALGRLCNDYGGRTCSSIGNTA
jgi:energy-coupling factor transporter ATP-binding protein EcfA2